MSRPGGKVPYTNKLFKYNKHTDARNLITRLCIDSRSIVDEAHALFIALKGTTRDGHEFIDEAYSKGIRCFLISKAISSARFP
ncbi:MAG: hypothetical protein K6U74_20370, partial [Firmicutes bacterium]|nr:hypothetical protein [Bacillota bacterium]